MKHFFRRIFVAAFILLAFSGCSKPEEESGSKVPYEEQQRRQATEKALKFLRDDIMKSYYYWYNFVPTKKFDYKTDIFQFFDDLLYSKDRWSWMMDGKTYMDSEQGLQTGTFGIKLGQMIEYYNDYGVFVSLVYPGGPFDQAGVKRGWEIISIDKERTDEFIKRDSEALSNLFNNPSTTKAHLFKFKDTEGETHEIEILAAESLATRPGLIKKIFTERDYPGLTRPVGYFNYLSFMADNDINGKSMLEDITEAMEYFKENNVKTLILDLRYNGGGDSRASGLLVNYLAPASARGQVYVNRVHNQKYSSEDEASKVTSPAEFFEFLKKKYDTDLVCKPESPEFTTLYFITGKGSASASEMVLNGLKPLSNLHHVGNITYGKPNGMYVFLYPTHLASYDQNDYSGLKYVFLPICFYNANGLGQMIPDEGITPDNKRPDDLYHDFGPEEDNIGACLYHIVHGSYPDLPEKTFPTKATVGVDARLNEWENSKNYGRYTVKRDF